MNAINVALIIMLFIYTLPVWSYEQLKFIIGYIKQNLGISATRLCKSLIYFCIFKETVAVLYGYTYYETPCIMANYFWTKIKNEGHLHFY